MVRARFLTVGVGASREGQNDPCANELELGTGYGPPVCVYVSFNIDTDMCKYLLLYTRVSLFC